MFTSIPLWPSVILIVIGLAVFCKAWALLPISGVIALLGYIALGIVAPLIASGDASLQTVVFAGFAILLVIVFTCAVLRHR